MRAMPSDSVTCEASSEVSAVISMTSPGWMTESTTVADTSGGSESPRATMPLLPDGMFEADASAGTAGWLVGCVTDATRVWPSSVDAVSVLLPPQPATQAAVASAAMTRVALSPRAGVEVVWVMGVSFMFLLLNGSGSVDGRRSPG